MQSKSKAKHRALLAGVSLSLGLSLWLFLATVEEPVQADGALPLEPSIHERSSRRGQTPTPNLERSIARRRVLPNTGAEPNDEPVELLFSENLPGAAFREEDYSKSRMQIYFEFQRAVQTWTPEVFDQKTRQRETLSGEELYEAYVYLRSCLDSLRSVAAYEQRARRMEDFHQRRPEEFSLQDVESSLERFRQELARCEGVGEDLPTELEPLLVEWLTLAADRGYPQAQLAYHQSVRWLLSRQRMTVFRNPLAVHEYRQRAPAYLHAAVRSGHSEAFVEYSLALQEGVLFKADREMAFAYARAADIAAKGSNDTATTYMAILENDLDSSQLAKARKTGRELCDQWCL